MQTHTLIQGSQEWLAYRANHFNASDAPAMMGVSPYKTRTELLHELHTGMAKEVDAATQARFDDGHRFEALARAHAEQIIGEDLFPVTGSAGRLSASFDGLTMMEDVAWEHKTLNDHIRAAATVSDLGAHLRVQMEQQMLVSGAERVLFTASRWSDAGELLEEKHFWYEGDAALRADIIAGWDQLEKDLAAYVPAAAAEKPAAEVIMALPALVVQTRGEVVQSNLPQFQAAAERFIANIKTDLATDEDFANAEATVKFCDKAEKDLEHTKSAVLGQAATIDDVMRTIDSISAQLRAKRLALTKLVDSKKLQIKETILSTAKLAYAEHVAALEAEMKPLRLTGPAPDFAGAMKNKRTLASLNDAVNTLLAGAKIATNATAADYRAKQAWCKEHAAGFGALFTDMVMAAIITKPMDDFQLVVTTRIEAHKQAEAKKEAELRARIAAEEQAKAEAAAKAKADAEERERQRAADAAQRLPNEQAAAALAEQNRLAAVAAEQQRAAERAAANIAADSAPSSVERLQGLADQNLAHKRELAQVERITGVPMRTVPYPMAGAPLAALADDVVNAEYPADSDIIDMMCEKFGLLPAEAIERLAVFDAVAARAALVAEAA